MPGNAWMIQNMETSDEPKNLTVTIESLPTMISVENIFLITNGKVPIECIMEDYKHKLKEHRTKIRQSKINY